MIFKRLKRDYFYNDGVYALVDFVEIGNIHFRIEIDPKHIFFGYMRKPKMSRDCAHHYVGIPFINIHIVYHGRGKNE